MPTKKTYKSKNENEFSGELKMIAKGISRHINLGAVFLSTVAVVVAVVWVADEVQGRSTLAVVNSQSNISHDGDDRVRLVPDNLFGVDFVDTQFGWAAGYYGTILKTIDGGKNWTHIPLPNTDLIRRIQFLDKDHGWLVTHRGRIMSSDNGGSTWETRYLDDNQINLRNIKFFNADIGWAVGHEGTILHTNDGGETWVNQHLSNFGGRDLPRLNGLAVLSESQAMLVGEFGVIAETVDRGHTWKIISSPDFKATFTEIEQVGDSIFAVGLDGVVARVHSDGVDRLSVPEGEDPVRVELLNSGVDQHFFDITANENGEGIVVGLANILTIKNGNELNTIEIDRPDRDYLYFMGAAPISGTKYFLVGAGGVAMTLDTATTQMMGSIKW
ncbi:MAG: photosystem II stability/assembly factor-like uncharacterized protein [Polaribacter sp.]|jgi:photosystem II stability/assembly factor-like uncharacterized protein